MYTLDDHEMAIVRELIKNPRLSDNKIAKKTGISLRTVNRKRKLLEDKGYLYYFAHLNNWTGGLEVFSSRKQYTIVLKEGITVKGALGHLPHLSSVLDRLSKHIYTSDIAEYQGHVCFIFTIESRVESDIIEIFNAEIVPAITDKFGHDAIKQVMTFDIRQPLRLLHNYIPIHGNMARGKLKQEWPSSSIFVADR